MHFGKVKGAFCTLFLPTIHHFANIPHTTGLSLELEAEHLHPRGASISHAVVKDRVRQGSGALRS